jgi:hypothetical protein
MFKLAKALKHCNILYQENLPLKRGRSSLKGPDRGFLIFWGVGGSGVGAGMMFVP